MGSTSTGKKKSGWKVILVLLVIYIGLAVLDALGVFVMGTYDQYIGDERDTDSPVIVEFNGELGGDDGELGMSYKVHGENITIYWGDEQFASGKIVNGVMKLSVLGGSTYYCKEGKKPGDFNNKGFFDYLRMILSPVSKMVSNLLHG